MFAFTVVTAVTVLIMFVVGGGRDVLLSLTDLPSFTALLAVAALSAGLRFGAAPVRVAFTFTGVVLIAAIPLVGPLGAALLGVGAALLDARQGWWQAVALNGSMLAMSAAVASWTYEVLGGVQVASTVLDGADTSDLVLRIGLPLMAADVVLLLVNLVALALVTRLDPQGAPMPVVLRGALATAPTYLAWGVVAFVVVALWGPGGLNMLALFLAVAPLVVTRRIHALFAEERRTRAGIIDALAASGGPPEAAAHTRRVAALAMPIATELGVGGAHREVLADTVRLHSVGRGRGCADEAGCAVDGALAAEAIVGRVEFLGAVASAVRHQAESFDGSGGPDGLAGLAIPVESRILAVADALVVAQERGLSPAQALDVVDEGSGVCFDPAVVAAARRAYGGGAVSRPPVEEGHGRTRHRAGRRRHARREVTS